MNVVASGRSAVGAYLDHHAKRGPCQERLATGNVALELRFHEFFSSIGCAIAASAVEAHNVGGPTPTRIRLGGRSRISPNCRFQQISCSSLSNTGDYQQASMRSICGFPRFVYGRVSIVE